MTHIHGGPRTDPSELQGKKTDIFHVSTVVSVILNHSQCFLTHHPRQPEKKEEKRGKFSFCLAPQWQCLDSQLQQMCCPRVRCGANSCRGLHAAKHDSRDPGAPALESSKGIKPKRAEALTARGACLSCTKLSSSNADPAKL